MRIRRSVRVVPGFDAAGRGAHFPARVGKAADATLDNGSWHCASSPAIGGGNPNTRMYHSGEFYANVCLLLCALGIGAEAGAERATLGVIDDIGASRVSCTPRFV